jgi:hypothetical protein
VQDDWQDEAREPIDAVEVFEHVRDINDPEHPYTLEQLNVVCEDHIDVDDAKGRVRSARCAVARDGHLRWEGLKRRVMGQGRPMPLASSSPPSPPPPR